MTTDRRHTAGYLRSRCMTPGPHGRTPCGRTPSSGDLAVRPEAGGDGRRGGGVAASTLISPSSATDRLRSAILYAVRVAQPREKTSGAEGSRTLDLLNAIPSPGSTRCGVFPEPAWNRARKRSAGGGSSAPFSRSPECRFWDTCGYAGRTPKPEPKAAYCRGQGTQCSTNP